MGFLPIVIGFTNMINLISLNCRRLLSQDNFNITYNLWQRAQACLDRSAPCLGLIVYFIEAQYRLKKLQYNFTKLAPELRNLSYIERLKSFAINNIQRRFERY